MQRGSDSVLSAEVNGPDELLGPDWWRTEANLVAQLRDLVPGLDSIGSFAIPFARLPRRLGAYAAEFPRWADVASQTPQALLLRPKLGDSAIRALIETAREAVRINQDTITAGKVGAEAAVARLIGQLDDFDRAILTALQWTLDPVSKRVIAERLGVHPVSVQRNLPRAQARFAELLADPAHQEVGELANEVRCRLGPYVPADVVGVELRRLGIDPSGQTAEVLLHVAGPYRRCGTWLETSPEGGGGAQAAAAVDAIFDRQAAPSTDTLLQALIDLGMPAGIALLYLETQVALRRFGDTWVRWTGDTAANMTEAALSRPRGPGDRRSHPRHRQLCRQHQSGTCECGAVKALPVRARKSNHVGAAGMGHPRVRRHRARDRGPHRRSWRQRQDRRPDRRPAGDVSGRSGRLNQVIHIHPGVHQQGWNGATTHR